VSRLTIAGDVVGLVPEGRMTRGACRALERATSAPFERTASVRLAADMGDIRRARPTIRCVIEDLGLELPGLDTDLGELDDAWIAELRRIAATSPTGQKRILAIDHPLVYRLRVSSERGATWVDEDGVVWLCAVRRREEGSDDDAFAWFAELHQDGRLHQPMRTFSGIRPKRRFVRSVGSGERCSS